MDRYYGTLEEMDWLPMYLGEQDAPTRLAGAFSLFVFLVGGTRIDDNQPFIVSVERC